MHFPTWVDLKGQDAVPETVHHVVCYVDPNSDTSWHSLPRKVKVRERKRGVQREREREGEIKGGVQGERERCNLSDDKLLCAYFRLMVFIPKLT